MPLYSRRVIHGAEKRYLSRPDIEAYADRNVFLNSQDVPEEARGIWDGKVLREFKGPDGKPFVQPSNQDGRYVFSLCMDGFNPFIMKEAGKQVSVEAIYMVLLSLPVEICYQVVNMFLVGIIPGPREPSLEHINHVLVPLVDNLLRFWKPSVCYFYLLNLLCRGVALALMFVAARRTTLPPSLIRSYSLVRLIFAAVGRTFSLSLNPLTPGV